MQAPTDGVGTSSVGCRWSNANRSEDVYKRQSLNMLFEICLLKAMKEIFKMENKVHGDVAEEAWRS